MPVDGQARKHLEKEKLEKDLSQGEEANARRWFERWLFEEKAKFAKKRVPWDPPVLRNFPVWIMADMRKYAEKEGQFVVGKGFGTFREFVRHQAMFVEDYEVVDLQMEMEESLPSPIGDVPMDVVPNPVDFTKFEAIKKRGDESQSDFERRLRKFRHITKHVEDVMKFRFAETVSWEGYEIGIQERINEMTDGILSEMNFWNEMDQAVTGPNANPKSFNMKKTRAGKEDVSGDWNDFDLLEKTAAERNLTPEKKLQQSEKK